MTQAEILNEFKQLSIKQQLEVIEAAIRIFQENFDAIAPLNALTDQQADLSTAAGALLVDYVEDKALTDFTVLDGEDFYVKG
jgi:hypothetical protein